MNEEEAKEAPDAAKVVSDGANESSDEKPPINPPTQGFPSQAAASAPPQYPGTELPPGMGFPQGHQAYFGGVPGVGLPTGSAGNLPTLGYPAVLGNSPGTVGNVFIPPELGGMLQNLTVNWMPAPTVTAPDCPPGLEYLIQLDQIVMMKQFGLPFTGNTYRFRNAVGQDLYIAKEISTPFQRQHCGPGRDFSMSVEDSTQREVMHFERPLSCHCDCNGMTCFCCCSFVSPHQIEVQSPPGNVIGQVKQDPLGYLRPWFNIRTADEQTMFKIKGPTLGCSCYSDTNFEILSADRSQVIGGISKKYGTVLNETFTIQFPVDLDVKMKAIMMAALILIHFMFFERIPGSRVRSN